MTPITPVLPAPARLAGDLDRAEGSTTTGPLPQLPQRIRPPMFTRKHIPPLSAEKLGVVAERLRHLDDAAPAAAGYPYSPDPAAEPHYPTVGDLMDARAAAADMPSLDTPIPAVAAAPVPVAVPSPEPELPAAEPFPGWLRDFLLGMVDDAAYGIGEALSGDCSLDRHAASGWCEACTDLFERGGRYARLQELMKDAPDSGAAVRTLLAEGWR